MSAPVVLLIEDDAYTAEMYRAFLTHRGYQVVVAADGEAGLRSVHEDGPDLVVLDVALPRLSGWEVARRLKADVDTRRIPLLAVTAMASDADRERADRLGVDGYYAKPIEPSRLFAEVRRFLEVAPG